MDHPFREGNSRNLCALFPQMIKKEQDLTLDDKNVTQKSWIEASIPGASGYYKL